MRILVMPKLKLAHIHPEIYGNFSEHLGRCIYGGVYVGENSRMRKAKDFAGHAFEVALSAAIQAAASRI